jgi:Fe-S cluster biogenesis protein NfuA
MTLAWVGKERSSGGSVAFDVPEVPLSGVSGQLACLSLLETYEERPKCAFEPGVICPQYISVVQKNKVLASRSLSAPPPSLIIIDAHLAVTKKGSGIGTVTSEPAGINCGVGCEEQYAEGTSVRLTGTPGANTKAVQWTGCDSVDAEGKCLVAMNAAKIVTATFDLEQHLLTASKEGSGIGTVTSEPAGIACGSECSASYNHGTTATLTASPEPGSQFSGWTGCDSETEGKCVITLTAAKTVNAKFNEVKSLSVQKEGAGLGSVKSSPAGISCMKACDSARMKFSDGSLAKEVTLTATPFKGSTFVEWGGDCAGNAPTCKLTLSAGKSVTAEFAPIPKVDLTVNKVGAGTVKSSPASINCAATCSTQTSGFYEGSEVELTETPYKSTFVQWTGACSGASSTCRVTMSEAKTVGAEFTGAPAGSVPLTLKKAVGSTGTGKVQIYAGGINCDAGCTAGTAVFKSGAKVVLKETPSRGSTFVDWGGACSGPGICEVTLSEAKEVTAEFEAIPANALTVRKAGGGTGMVKSKPAGVNCGLICPQAVASYPQTASVTLTATPGKGSGPVQWAGCDEVTGGLCVATMSSAKEVTAKFE